MNPPITDVWPSLVGWNEHDARAFLKRHGIPVVETVLTAGKEEFRNRVVAVESVPNGPLATSGMGRILHIEARGWARYLPEIFRGMGDAGETPFIERFLLLCEERWREVEEGARSCKSLLSPLEASPPVLKWMAGWLGVSPRLSSEVLRALLPEAVHLHRHRGTSAAVKERVWREATVSVQILPQLGPAGIILGGIGHSGTPRASSTSTAWLDGAPPGPSPCWVTVRLPSWGELSADLGEEDAESRLRHACEVIRREMPAHLHIHIEGGLPPRPCAPSYEGVRTLVRGQPPHPGSVMTLRLRPFAGLPLGASHLVDEQLYHREARRRHLLHHHGVGIVSGLACEELEDREVIAVSKGYAITPIGEEVCLPGGILLSLSALGIRGGEEYRVVLRFVEAPDPQSYLEPFGGGEAEPCRIEEGAEVALLSLGTPRGQNEVELARFAVDERGRMTVAGLDRSHALRFRAPRPPEDGVVKDGVKALVMGLQRLPLLVEGGNGVGMWLAMATASVDIALLGESLSGDEAASLAVHLLLRGEAWFAQDPSPRRAQSWNTCARAALSDWRERDGDGGRGRIGWAMKWLPLLRAALESQPHLSSPQRVFREVAREEPPVLHPIDEGRES